MRALVLPVAVVLGCVLSLPAAAIQFSAEAIMSSPSGVDVSTHLYYSSGRIRKDFMYYGEPVIQILNAKKQNSLMCFTEQRLCYENTSLEQINIGIENTSKSPCESNSDLSCENQGEEILHDRQVLKWKISTKVKGKDEKPEVSYLWLDKEFNIPVKQVLFNKTTIELHWLGHEIINERNTDKWVQKIKLKDGKVQESFQWFDQELKISIRESFANGNSQELKHIVVENLPDTLFTVPTGFEKRVVQANSKTASNKKTTQKPKKKTP